MGAGPGCFLSVAALFLIDVLPGHFVEAERDRNHIRDPRREHDQERYPEHGGEIGEEVTGDLSLMQGAFPARKRWIGSTAWHEQRPPRWKR